MLRSISTSKPFRGLDTAPMSQGGPTNVFGKKTVIYGRNGAGKTSISEVLRQGDETGLADQAAITASIYQNGSKSSNQFGSPTFPLRALVYNRYYVAESLAIFLEGTGVSQPILKLGKANVDAALEMQLINEVIARYSSWQSAVRNALGTAKSEEKWAENSAKADTIEKLSPGDPQKYDSTRYRTDVVRKHLKNEGLNRLSPEKLAAEVAKACAPAIETAGLLSPTPEAPADLEIRSVEALTRKIASNPLEELVENPDLEAWTEDGLDLHSDGDLCKFCHSGVIAKATLDRYRQHFSEELQLLRSDVQSLIKEVEERKLDLSNWFANIPAAGNILIGQRATYETARYELANKEPILTQEADSLIELLRERLADPLLPLAPERAVATFTPLATAEIERLLAENDKACADQGATKLDAQMAVEKHIAAGYKSKYDSAVARQEVATRCVAAIDRRIESLTERARQLNESQQDTGRMAVRIHEDLHQHFGHNHLSVGVSPDGKGYVVRRNGGIASHLSEGERNAIAYSYFLSSLEADGVDPLTTLVVVDDPVTSLDKEALFAAFALAEERTSNFAQSIFLTHDYEFFRLQMNQRSGALKKSRKLIDDGDANEAAFPRVSILEVFAAIDRTSGHRVSRIRPLNQELLRHPSEYHYLFCKVGKAVVGQAGDELPLLGNAARRLFEGFITFRAPQGQDFQAKVTAISLARAIDATLSKRVVKFLHGHSHREDPTPATALDFPSIELELKSVLAYMNTADGEHFENMCKAVDIDVSAMKAELSPISVAANPTG